MFGWLKLPATKNIADLDDPGTTQLHAQIIRQKAFLRNTYIGFYRHFKTHVPQTQNKLLVELGSGGGFIKQHIPNVITSDVIDLTTVDKVFSAMEMPFENDSIDALFMIDVLHHITDPTLFFKEAIRCLKPGGKVVMVEPASTLWGKYIYQNFHHELFETSADWQLKETGPLSHGNGALPWIIFTRDRQRYEKQFPSLKIISIRKHSPIRYLASGGFTLRQLLPGFMWPVIVAIEFLLYPLNNLLGMFQTIVLQKK